MLANAASRSARGPWRWRSRRGIRRCAPVSSRPCPRSGAGSRVGAPGRRPGRGTPRPSAGAPGPGASRARWPFRRAGAGAGPRPVRPGRCRWAADSLRMGPERLVRRRLAPRLAFRRRRARTCSSRSRSRRSSSSRRWRGPGSASPRPQWTRASGGDGLHRALAAPAARWIHGRAPGQRPGSPGRGLSSAQGPALAGAAACVLADGRVAVAEAELLRAVAGSLGLMPALLCPLEERPPPPLRELDALPNPA